MDRDKGSIVFSVIYVDSLKTKSRSLTFNSRFMTQNKIVIRYDSRKTNYGLSINIHNRLNRIEFEHTVVKFIFVKFISRLISYFILLDQISRLFTSRLMFLDLIIFKTSVFSPTGNIFLSLDEVKYIYNVR